MFGRLPKIFRSLVRSTDHAPGHRPGPACPLLTVGSVAIPFAADVLAPPGAHNPGASGSNPESAITGSRQLVREDIKRYADEDSDPWGWPE